MVTLRIEREGDESSAARLQIGPSSARISPEQFRHVADDAGRQRLFALSVKTVVLELSSYCNRRCRFCPNVEGSRLGHQALLDENLFVRIVGDLAKIDYSSRIFWHLYNEPLAAPEVLLPRVAYARSQLPKAHFALNTNGDYLNKDLLAELGRSGCNSIFVSIYGREHGRWEDDYIRDRVTELAGKLGIKGSLVAQPGDVFSIAARVNGMSVTVCGRNLWKVGYDRGGLLPELAVERSSPCLSPFTDFLIDHRGYALPCCNVYTDRPEHLAHTLGNVRGNDIFTIYAGAVARSWRRGVLKFDPGGSLCEGCSRANYPELDSRKNRDDLAKLIEAVAGECKSTDLPAGSVVATADA